MADYVSALQFYHRDQWVCFKQAARNLVPIEMANRCFIQVDASWVKQINKRYEILLKYVLVFSDFTNASLVWPYAPGWCAALLMAEKENLDLNFDELWQKIGQDEKEQKHIETLMLSTSSFEEFKSVWQGIG